MGKRSKPRPDISWQANPWVWAVTFRWLEQPGPLPEGARIRPISFKPEMVRAIMAREKTQTRRVVREKQPTGYHYLQALYGHAPDGQPFGKRGLWCEVGPDYPDDESDHVRCPYGAPGDRLWVKEAIRHGGSGRSVYVADGAPTNADAWPWKPQMLAGMYMPRRLSRITLEVTDVRAQRLRDISEDDARAEGVTLGKPVSATINGEPGSVAFFDARRAYAALWDSINAPRKKAA